MKYIRLTQGYYTIVDDEVFDYLSQFNWRIQSSAGNRNIYAYRSKAKTSFGQENRTVPMHREILEFFGMPVPTGYVVDHINGNSLFNLLLNLRSIPEALNISKRRLARTKSGYFGVFWNEAKQLYEARSYNRGHARCICADPDIEVCARLRDYYYVKHIDKWCHLNFENKREKYWMSAGFNLDELIAYRESMRSADLYLQEVGITLNAEKQLLDPIKKSWVDCEPIILG